MSEIKPIAYDLFCGLGGWTEGLLAAGYDVTGFDIEAHEYGEQKYPARLVLRDVLSIHGSEFKDAALIVASPPCQEYSYMAMPFSRGKAIAKALRGQCEFPEGYTGSRTIEQLNALFNACFRIQCEASEAAGRHVPMVVENVKGAQPWVGSAKANFGSFYLWGDVDMVGDRIIAGGLRWESVRAAKRGAQKHNPDGTEHGQGSWFKVADSKERGGRKVPGMNFHDFEKTGKPGRSFQSVDGLKRPCQSISSGFNNWPKDEEGAYVLPDGSKCGGGWFGKGNDQSKMRKHNSRSQARKAASAQIAKIPYTLSHYIANAYKPK